MTVSSEDAEPHADRAELVDQVEQPAGDAALVGRGGGEETTWAPRYPRAWTRGAGRAQCRDCRRRGARARFGDHAQRFTARAVVVGRPGGHRDPGRRPRRHRRTDRLGRAGRRGAAGGGRRGRRAARRPDAGAGQRPLPRADGAVPRPGRGAAAGPLAAGGHVAARGAADAGGRRGRDDRRVGGDAGQRRDHQRRDVLPSGTDRRGGRADRRPRDHRDAAAAAARPAAVRGAAAGRRRPGRRARPATAPSSTASARTPPTPCRCRCSATRPPPPASTACCCTCTSPRPRPRAPTCSAAHGLSVPALLAAHDVLGGRVLAAHCVHMDDGDLELWQRVRRRRRALPGQQRQAGQRRRAGCGTCSTAASGWAWAPTGRRPTTGSTCSPTCGSPPRWPGWPARSATALTAAEAFWLATGAAADADRPAGPRAARGGPAGRPGARRHPGPGVRAGGRPGRPAGAPGLVRRRPARARRLGGRPAGGRATAPRRRSTPTALRADVAARAARLAAG